MKFVVNNNGGSKMKKSIISRLDYFDRSVIVLCILVILIMIICFMIGSTYKVNKLCNKYEGNLPFCKVSKITYVEQK